jgi:hypothetical protein
VSTYPASGAGTQFAIVDAERDRLYVLQGDGQLIVLRGHGEPVALPPRPAPDRRAALSIIPSPGAQSSLVALFADGEYSNRGALYLTRDEGATWNALNNSA